MLCIKRSPTAHAIFVCSSRVGSPARQRMHIADTHTHLCCWLQLCLFRALAWWQLVSACPGESAKAGPCPAEQAAAPGAPERRSQLSRDRSRQPQPLHSPHACSWEWVCMRSSATDKSCLTHSMLWVKHTWRFYAVPVLASTFEPKQPGVDTGLSEAETLRAWKPTDRPSALEPALALPHSVHIEHDARPKCRTRACQRSCAAMRRSCGTPQHGDRLV